MATHETQNVSYMRKDEHFLADGTWYLTVDCPIHGMVDEEVSWDDAKTPHHAGTIADQRHQACQVTQSEKDLKLAAKAEIAAAESELNRVKNLEKLANEELERLKNSDKPVSRKARNVEGELVDVDTEHGAQLKQSALRVEYLDGSTNAAQKRLKLIKKENSKPSAWTIAPHNPD
jgi:hypothetical protein